MPVEPRWIRLDHQAITKIAEKVTYGDEKPDTERVSRALEKMARLFSSKGVRYDGQNHLEVDANSMETFFDYEIKQLVEILHLKIRGGRGYGSERI